MERWATQNGRHIAPCDIEWRRLIETVPWERVRKMLLEESDEGQRLRSSQPFLGGVVSAKPEQMDAS